MYSPNRIIFFEKEAINSIVNGLVKNGILEDRAKSYKHTCYTFTLSNPYDSHDGIWMHHDDYGNIFLGNSSEVMKRYGISQRGQNAVKNTVQSNVNAAYLTGKLFSQALSSVAREQIVEWSMKDFPQIKKILSDKKVLGVENQYGSNSLFL